MKCRWIKRRERDKKRGSKSYTKAYCVTVHFFTQKAIRIREQKKKKKNKKRFERSTNQNMTFCLTPADAAKTFDLQRAKKKKKKERKTMKQRLQENYFMFLEFSRTGTSSFVMFSLPISRNGE
eukprot:TRINITY_DN4360_c1_g1_i1.p1 TRINITY_DN4360_c1_g1~~TRINITY_DN4360_c1_g1_i1.p1  ORF type:complete len:123 (-),score=13.94 TRINITY_DN4360_c1_g1_i1:211-579(-)